MNNKRHLLGLLITPLILLLLVSGALGSAGAGAEAEYDLTDRLWEIETLLEVSAIPPHFDYLNIGYPPDKPKEFYFSYVEAATGDLQVAHWTSDSINIETVAHSEEPGALTGVGNDLELISGAPIISYSQLNPDGSGTVALARYESGWVSETIHPRAGGGSTRYIHHKVANFPYAPFLFFSGRHGLFEAHENPTGSGWLTARIDAGASANTPLSMATDRMGFISLAYCGQTTGGSTLMEAWPNYEIELWDPVPVLHETCTDAMHFGAQISGGTQYIISTNKQLKFIIGSYDPRVTIIDKGAPGVWIGRGLSGGTNISQYWIAYTAYGINTGQTTLRLAFNDIYEGGWHLVAGPAGHFAEWTHLETLRFDGSRPTKISLLYYDTNERALKRASWPPKPDLFLPIIR